jgi:hypothetical protein
VELAGTSFVRSAVGAVDLTPVHPSDELPLIEHVCPLDLVGLSMVFPLQPPKNLQPSKRAFVHPRTETSLPAVVDNANQAFGGRVIEVVNARAQIAAQQG